MPFEANLTPTSIRDLVVGFSEKGQAGVSALAGRLDIRPPYQREFVYDPPEQEAVISTVSQGLPLGCMFWADCGNGNFEVVDGQQRLLSICRFVNEDFSCPNIFGVEEPRFFDGLSFEDQASILDYELMVFTCKGSKTDKMKWFRTVNIAGKRLTLQEIRNAVYQGPWVVDAKSLFSYASARPIEQCARYMKGSVKRQDYLEQAIVWLVGKREQAIEEYMGSVQKEKRAAPLLAHFDSVVRWIESTFPEWREHMRDVEWGRLFHDHCARDLDPVSLEREVKRWMESEEITRKGGIYEYVLTGNPSCVKHRKFTQAQKRVAYEKQNGLCAHPKCGTPSVRFAIGEGDADHITPWHEDGETIQSNCQFLCRKCNRSNI